MKINNTKKNITILSDICKPYFYLFKFKFNPLESEASKIFFFVNLLIYAGIEFIFIESNMVGWWKAFFQVILETSFTCFFVKIILFLNNSKNIFYPLASAILLCENTIAIIIVTIDYMAIFSSHNSVTIAIIIVFFWDMLFINSILKNTLLIESKQSLPIYFMYFLTTYGGSYEFIYISSYLIGVI